MTIHVFQHLINDCTVYKYIDFVFTYKNVTSRTWRDTATWKAIHKPNTAWIYHMCSHKFDTCGLYRQYIVKKCLESWMYMFLQIFENSCLDCPTSLGGLVNDISVLTFHPKCEVLVLNQAGHWQSAWHLSLWQHGRHAVWCYHAG